MSNREFRGLLFYLFVIFCSLLIHLRQLLNSEFVIVPSHFTQQLPTEGVSTLDLAFTFLHNSHSEK